MAPHPDISPEIIFRTARSGGKGGQHVNKVETMVEGYFDVMASTRLTPEEKNRVLARLANRINAQGLLQVRSQTHRSQLSNKEEVVRKMNGLLQQALKKEKKRIATRTPGHAREKRLNEKKIRSDHKKNRQKVLRGSAY